MKKNCKTNWTVFLIKQTPHLVCTRAKIVVPLYSSEMQRPITPLIPEAKQVPAFERAMCDSLSLRLMALWPSVLFTIWEKKWFSTDWEEKFNWTMNFKPFLFILHHSINYKGILKIETGINIRCSLELCYENWHVTICNKLSKLWWKMWLQKR